MVKETLFTPDSIEQNAFLLASHMPQGRVWWACFDPSSNMGKLVQGLAVEYYRLQLQTGEISTEMDIDETLALLPEWETSVRLPGGCFDTNGTIEERREQVKGILSNFGGVQTAEDFERVALLFGFDVTVTPGNHQGQAYFPLPFPFVFFDSSRSAGHTIIVNFNGAIPGAFFPLEFPFEFGNIGVGFLQCLFDLLAPANVKVSIVTG